MASVIGTPIDRQRSERRFYSGMALFLTAIVFIGFAPSFYLKDIVPAYPRPNPTLPPSVIMHGVLFTLWMAVLIAQTQLVAAGRRDLHMKLGTASLLLALAIIPVMYLAAVWQVARANQPPFTDPLNWTIVPLAVIPAFAYLIYAAWRRRREAQWHKRLMLGAAILVVVGPGFTRIPLSPPSLFGFFLQMLAGLALLFAPMLIWDHRSTGKVHPATWTALLATAAASLVPMLFLATGTWAPIARYLPGL